MLLCLFTLIFTSFHFVRKYHFETFFYTHQAIVLVFYTLLCVHGLNSTCMRCVVFCLGGAGGAKAGCKVVLGVGCALRVG